MRHRVFSGAFSRRGVGEGVALVGAECGGQRRGGWEMGTARQRHLLGVLPVGTQAEGGRPEAWWHGVRVLTQGAKASSDSGQEPSQGRRKDGQVQGMRPDHGQQQVKSGSGRDTKCRQVGPRSSRPRLWPKRRGQSVSLNGSSCRYRV